MYVGNVTPDVFAREYVANQTNKQNKIIKTCSAEFLAYLNQFEIVWSSAIIHHV